MSAGRSIVSRILLNLSSDGEQVFRSEGLGYYTDPRLRIPAEDASHLRLPLVDGGYVDGMATLLADRKEQMLSTGIGPDLAVLRFRSQRSGTAER